MSRGAPHPPARSDPYRGAVQAPRLPVPGQESGPQVLVLGLGGCVGIVAVDLLLSGRLTMFFDLAFITLCLALTPLVRADGVFLACFLPPVMMVAVFGLVHLVDPEAIGNRDDGLLQSVIAGLTAHAAALAIGYAICLVALGLRLRGPLSPRTG